MEDLKLLYRAYVSDVFSSGHMEDNKLAALNQLRNIFGLGKHETKATSLDVTSKKKLQQCITDRELNDDDVVALLKLRDAMASGVDGHDDDIKKSVIKAAHGLRLNRETVMSIASKLSVILGLNCKEILDVHKSLDEQGFRQQTEVILANGQLTKARAEQLSNL
ncbi:hypothetical protein VNO77_34144 [Canavalia gladiata]|uniref:Uncharacterized protein n=1 Tax=Canavalia gladiata TaxID=3824 RepID=A0AAN9PZ04_CANGL